MQVTTKTTVYLCGSEIRDILSAHLRSEGVLPEHAKFEMQYTPPLPPGGMITSGHPPDRTVEIQAPDSMRVTVSWPQRDDQVVAKVGT
jgi:hypothetical protein